MATRIRNRGCDGYRLTGRNRLRHPCHGRREATATGRPNASNAPLSQASRAPQDVLLGVKKGLHAAGVACSAHRRGHVKGLVKLGISSKGDSGLLHDLPDLVLVPEVHVLLLRDAAVDPDSGREQMGGRRLVPVVVVVGDAAALAPPGVGLGVREVRADRRGPKHLQWKVGRGTIGHIRSQAGAAAVGSASEGSTTGEEGHSERTLGGT